MEPLAQPKYMDMDGCSAIGCKYVLEIHVTGPQSSKGLIFAVITESWSVV